MKKFISALIIFAFATTSIVRADETTSVQRQPREVGKAPEEVYNAGKRKQWQNILLAFSAVTVAVVTVLLVSNHHKHHKHKHHNDDPNHH